MGRPFADMANVNTDAAKWGIDDAGEPEWATAAEKRAVAFVAFRKPNGFEEGGFVFDGDEGHGFFAGLLERLAVLIVVVVRRGLLAADDLSDDGYHMANQSSTDVFAAKASLWQIVQQQWMLPGHDAIQCLVLPAH